MNDVTAIDVLIDSDEQATEGGPSVHARLLESMPEGRKLDDTQQRHITTLQRYVHTADLDRVYAAVESLWRTPTWPVSRTGV